MIRLTNTVSQNKYPRTSMLFQETIIQTESSRIYPRLTFNFSIRLFVNVNKFEHAQDEKDIFLAKISIKISVW